MATETVWHPGGAAAGGEQQYSLRWNDFHSAMVSSFRRLRDEEDFVDVTLACAGATFTAHKVVLSACSPYFRRLLKANPCQHPIVILRDVHDKDMESLLRFMYQGEVHIGQEQLKEFLRAAQLLQVRGLTDVPPPAPLTTLEQKASPVILQQSASSWTETGSGGSREGRDTQREGRRSRRPDEGANNTPPPKRARSSDLYQAQMKTRCRTEQLLASQGSPERLATNGHEMALFSHALENAQNPHLSNVSNNLSGDGEESSSDAGASDTEGENRTKQEPVDYDDPATMANTNGALPHNFPGLLNLPGFPGLPGPSGIPDNFGGCRRTQDLLRVRATDPRPCPKCGKIYRSAHTLRTHLEDKHTVCPGYRCVLCGTVAKSRNSLHSHMSRQHRGISTKDLPVLQMPTRFDPELASQLLAKAGVKVSPEQLRARASPTGPRRSDIKLDAKSAASESSSICGDNDHDDLSQSKYQDSIPVSPPHINNLTNTTITKVPAVRAVTAKAVENLPHGMTGMKHDDYPPGFGGGSALLDTYLQYIGENVFGMNAAKLAQMNAMHIERKTYDEPSPQMGSLPPPPTTLAHQRFLKQMQRQYTENMGKPDIMRDSEEPLDLGKERQRNDSINDETDRQDMEKDLNKDYYNKGYNDDDRSRIHMSEDRETMGHEDDFSEEDNKAAAS
ncbi:protein abrupt-like isoform X1 [Pieris brassicae]|uniref:protein abrupt-like isoform X1 n=1 Tax=Pieris brassicae TaxID=7116 RepID=UPI001E6619DD|nr:protein abrupt-like isoform X1 [Pieris brassicae]XP_045512751.1 protein abrupt-like isoform X1 [Pieris brassicae]XP_045512752.1 protein abrupt-like isoform X1 [Pieris brassicae]